MGLSVRATAPWSIAFNGAFFAWPYRRMQRILVSELGSNQGLLDALRASFAIPGVETIRIGVGPRIPRTKPDHIAPSRPIGVSQRVLILPIAQRRELFALGYADARRSLA